MRMKQIELKISCGYDLYSRNKRFFEFAKSKKIARFSCETKAWTIYIDEDLAGSEELARYDSQLTELGYPVSVILQEFVALKQEELAEQETQQIQEQKELNIIDDSVTKLPLLEYQKKVVARALVQKKLGLFLDMGTGKTATTIGILGNLYKQQKIKNAMIICPNSLIGTWISEFEKFANYPYQIYKLNGGGKQERERNFANFKTANDLKLNILLLNYECLLSLTDARSEGRVGDKFANSELAKIKFDVVVADETLKIKNYKAKQTKLALMLAEKAEYSFALNGTPISKDCTDIYSQAKFINSKIFSFSKFLHDYVNYKINRWGGYEIKGVKDEAEFKKWLAGFSVRILKQDCIDLPEKVYQRRDIQLSPAQKKLISEIHASTSIMLDSIKGLSTGAGQERKVLIENILTELLREQQVVNGFISAKDKTGAQDIVTTAENPKINELVEIVESSGDQKIVVFTRFVPDIDHIAEALYSIGVDCTTFSGRLSNEEKEESLKKFKTNPKCKVFIAQMQSGGFGLNLQEASICVFFSNWWTFGVRDQCESRLHRLGQKNNVLYIDLVAKDTIDETLVRVLKERKNLAEVLFGETNKEILMEVKNEN